MNDLEVAILESLHALGGRARIQEIYNRILRSYVTNLQRSGEIVRVSRGIYGLTEKGCRRIGIQPRGQTKSATSAANSIKYCVDNEFGGVVVTGADRIQPPREPRSKAKASQRPREGRPMTKCPVCRVSVRVDRVERHLKKVHPGGPGSAANRAPEPESASTEEELESPEEAVYQSDYESRFGDKYLGQMRRDYDGTFGSLPLYDDYGDESGPD